MARHSRHPTRTIRVDCLGRALGRKREFVESLSGAGSSPKRPRPAMINHLTTCSPAVVVSPRALQPAEKAQVREVLNSARFADQAPREVYASLIDEGKYLCSWRTMYRILDDNQKCGNAATSCDTPNTPNPSCWPPNRTSYGAGISPNCLDRRSGPTTTCTTSWMSSVATLSVG